jgi:hypothetical protein
MDNVNILGPDESGAITQLAARWAELHAPADRDSERGALSRFRVAHDYIEAVVRGVEPPEATTRMG